MKNPLILNIRCVCIDEYVKLQEIHENYRHQRSEGEILSVYVGADPKLYGKSKIIDKMLDKVFGDGAKPIPTERIMREKVVCAQGNGDGTITETIERTFVPHEKPLDLDEARAIGADYAEQETALDIAGASAPNNFEPQPLRVKPEITLEDVLVAEAEARNPMEAIETEAEGEPDGDGQDYNTTYAG